MHRSLPDEHLREAAKIPIIGLVASVEHRQLAEQEQLGFPLEGMEAERPVNAHAVRLELNEILDAAKSARDHAPWDLETHRKYRSDFPEKAKVLPPEEAEFLWRQFVLELERIDILLAA